MTDTIPTAARRSAVPTYPVLMATVVAICTVGMALNLVAAIAADKVDDGPRTLHQQLAGVIGFGLGALALATIGAWWFSRNEDRSRLGAVVFGLLCVPTLVLFFSGAPGMFGATSAYLAGLTRDRSPAAGVPRVFGVVGLTFAILNVLVAVLGIAVAWLVD